MEHVCVYFPCKTEYAWAKFAHGLKDNVTTFNITKYSGCVIEVLNLETVPPSSCQIRPISPETHFHL